MSVYQFVNVSLSVCKCQFISLKMSVHELVSLKMHCSSVRIIEFISFMFLVWLIICTYFYIRIIFDKFSLKIVWYNHKMRSINTYNLWLNKSYDEYCRITSSHMCSSGFWSDVRTWNTMRKTSWYTKKNQFIQQVNQFQLNYRITLSLITLLKKQLRT